MGYLFATISFNLTFYIWTSLGDIREYLFTYQSNDQPQPHPLEWLLQPQPQPLQASQIIRRIIITNQIVSSSKRLHRQFIKMPPIRYTLWFLISPRCWTLPRQEVFRTSWYYNMIRGKIGDNFLKSDMTMLLLSEYIPFIYRELNRSIKYHRRVWGWGYFLHVFVI